MLTFGVKWLDYDNDGWLDLMIANGHVYDNVGAAFQQVSYREPTQLFRNDRGRRLAEVGWEAGAGLHSAHRGAGSGGGGLRQRRAGGRSGRGREGPPLLLRNESRSTGHWLSFTLVGTGPKCNRDGYGAQVVVTAGGLTQTRVCHADGSYLSSSDKRVHVGLGAARTASVVIRWPDGHADRYAGVAGDRPYRVREGASTLK